MHHRTIAALAVASLVGCKSEPTVSDDDLIADTEVVDSPVDSEPGVVEETDEVVDTDHDGDTDVAVDTEVPVDSDTTPAPPPSVDDCFDPIWGTIAPVDYEQFHPVMARSCKGTNHQDIQGVERVVFIGDSVTLGTPPTAYDKWWRNRVADGLARRFGLQKPDFTWRNNDVISGDPLENFSGDFAVCAKYGARTDDILSEPHLQIQTCIPESERDKKTLVLMTIGGNDIYSLLEDVKAGVDEATLRQKYADATQLLRDAVEWLVAPGRFPNGVYVVFANTWDFTDIWGAQDMFSCPGAQLIGMDAPLHEPITWDILGDAAEEYLKIAVDTHTDLVFMGEAFCGHGNDPTDTASRCYRGPHTKVWFDLTCEHPNTLGHDAITDLFLSTIDE